jgi:hypothetical protein
MIRSYYFSVHNSEWFTFYSCMIFYPFFRICIIPYYLFYRLWFWLRLIRILKIFLIQLNDFNFFPLYFLKLIIIILMSIYFKYTIDKVILVIEVYFMNIMHKWLRVFKELLLITKP